jgi:hypothetical protein
MSLGAPAYTLFDIKHWNFQSQIDLDNDNREAGRSTDRLDGAIMNCSKENELHWRKLWQALAGRKSWESSQ